MLSFEAHAPISCHRATSTGLYMCSDSMYSERMNLLFYPLGYMDHIVLLRYNIEQPGYSSQNLVRWSPIRTRTYETMSMFAMGAKM